MTQEQAERMADAANRRRGLLGTPDYTPNRHTAAPINGEWGVIEWGAHATPVSFTMAYTEEAAR